jgi:CRISPR/Cas system-associated endonuclease Cas3-HD
MFPMLLKSAGRSTYPELIMTIAPCPPLFIGDACQYWTLLRLNAAGQARPQVMHSAKAFFQAKFGDDSSSGIDSRFTQPPSTEASIQAQLLVIARSPQADRELAALCLRCYISHQISWACRRLVHQFGRFYQFDLADLLPYGLEDDGRLHHLSLLSSSASAPPTSAPTSAPLTYQPRQTGRFKGYEPLGLKVLRTFQPGSGSLSGWTSRLLKTQPELVGFLLEQGLYLISDWAILNDTLPAQLEKVLTGFYQLSALSVVQAKAILTVYRDIYVSDRRLQPTLRCAVPTEGQLQRMAAQLAVQFNLSHSPAQLLVKLQQTAQCLRQYRIYRKGGPFPPQLQKAHSVSLFDIPDIRGSAPPEEPDGHLLEIYQAAFIEAFDDALAAALVVHKARFRSAQKRAQFQVALRLYHVHQLPMREIARRLGLRAQDAVVRLLRLKDLRAELRCQMQLQLRNSRLAAKITGVAAELARCDRALTAPTVDVQQALTQLFEAHLDTIIQTAQKEANTAVRLRKPSFFTERLCAHLDRNEGLDRCESA